MDPLKLDTHFSREKFGEVLDPKMVQNNCSRLMGTHLIIFSVNCKHPLFSLSTSKS